LKNNELLKRADFETDEEFIYWRTLREIQDQLSIKKPEPKIYDPWGSLKKEE
jgi:hypothetical protein